MKYYLKIVAVAVLALLTAQCEVIDSDLLNDPNNPSPSNLDPDFLLNNIQFEARNVYAGASSTGADMTRMRYMFGSTYGNAFSSQSFNGLYQNAYADLFIDVQNLLPIAEERQLFFHAGVAKVLQAYAMITLVDVFGDVPYSEALDPSTLNPNLDPGQEVYQAAIDMLAEAKADLQNQDRRALPETDLYYGESSDQEEAWVRAANTILLKAYLNTGNTSGFNDILTNEPIISSAEYDFTFQWGTNTVNPDSRHPSFSNNYVDQANDYMAVNYLNMFLNDKSIEDPRARYYFYRQTTSDPSDVNLKTCISVVNQPPGHFNAGDPWCLLGDGWWGRDHLINNGIPPDRGLRTTFGVYPAGGRFDANQGVSTDADQGYQGAGIDPILMSSYTWFMVAEGQLTLNNDEAAARAALETAIDLSFETVRVFGGAQADGSGFEIADNGGEAPTAYKDIVLTDRWDGGTRDKLRIISKEFYLALWPNGYEAYNMMRRTGYPNQVDNLQPARSPSPGDWYATFSYPAVMIERNSNVSAKSSTLTTTFWDDGNYDFNF
ncbi:MAG: SusD/RagB family nutrient-binding outer membrane lipoprotein [Bacteroidetes bacterium]|jgi:hypothetical protein|nr:SusD/RagB family nutrient-binding outer membrane lipoprotein [Bacteroidota bacterium]